MEWTVVGTYPNYETMESSFPLRHWGTMTTSVSPNFTKRYYYCKECRKTGPVRLQVRFQSLDSEVEVWQNTAEHNHSGKRTINDEMRAEILSLHRAGVKTSRQIVEAIQISKPELRVPSFKQISTVLKKPRREERKQLAKQKRKEKKQKEKMKQSGPNNKGRPRVTPISTVTLASTVRMSGSENQYGGGSGNPPPPSSSAGQIPNPVSLHQQQTINPLGLIGYDVHAMHQQQHQQQSSIPLYTNNIQHGLL
jgi:hypothetical protein